MGAVETPCNDIRPEGSSGNNVGKSIDPRGHTKAEFCSSRIVADKNGFVRCHFLRDAVRRRPGRQFPARARLNRIHQA